MKHPSVKKLARLSVFVIGYVMVNQIGYLIIQVLAAGQQGGYAAYVNAFTFFMLPHGLFAVSVITALLPGMSAHAINHEWDQLPGTAIDRDPRHDPARASGRGRLPRSRPADHPLAAWSTATRPPSPRNSCTSVLRVFVLGLVPFSLFQLFLRAFYAMQDTKTPFLINCGAVALNTAINIPMFALVRRARVWPPGMAIAYTFGSLVQGRTLSRRIAGIDGAHILRSTVRIGLAALRDGARGVAGLGADQEIVSEDSLFGPDPPRGDPRDGRRRPLSGLRVLFKVEELEMVKGIVGRRFKR